MPVYFSFENYFKSICTVDKFIETVVPKLKLNRVYQFSEISLLSSSFVLAASSHLQDHTHELRTLWPQSVYMAGVPACITDKSLTSC